MPISRLAIMPIRGMMALARNVPPSAIQKPNSFVTVAMSVLE